MPRKHPNRAYAYLSGLAKSVQSAQLRTVDRAVQAAEAQEISIQQFREILSTALVSLSEIEDHVSGLNIVRY